MKRKIILLSFLYYSIVAAQPADSISLVKHYIESDQNVVTRIQDISRVDLDNDGDLDLVVSDENNSIYWFENLDGQGNFSEKKFITSLTGSGVILDFVVKDINNDGFKDLIFSSTDWVGGGLTWLKGIDNNGNFSNQIEVNFYGIIDKIDLADFNQDGYTDLAIQYYDNIQSHTANIKVIFNNDGNLNTLNETTLYDTTDNITGLYAKDLDNDNLSDIVISTDSAGASIIIFKNTGQQNFNTITAASVNNGAAGMTLMDIDNDNDTDIVFYKRHNLYTLTNTLNINNWTLNTFNNSSYYIQEIYPLKATHTNDLILLTTSNGSHSLIWKENINGQGNFGADHTIFPDFNNLFITCDIDNDNLDEVIFFDDRIKIYKNQQNTFTFFRNISDPAIVYKPAGIRSADIDNDGLVDVIVYGYDNLLLYKALDNNGHFSSSVVIDENFPGQLFSEDIFLKDMDNDGDKDIIISRAGNSGAKIYLYENINGNFGSRVQLNPANTGYKLVITDLDNDGKNDIITSDYWNNGGIIFYKNTGGFGNFTSSFIYNHSISGGADAADIDNDGDIDLLFGNIILLNQGGNNFTEHHIDSSQNLLQTKKSLFKDMDNDGDLDVVVLKGYSNYFIGWYENTDGNGNFDQIKLIGSHHYLGIHDYNVDFDFIDLDNDGDDDIISYSENYGLIYYINFDGVGIYSELAPIDIDLNFYTLKTSDLNNDGHKELLIGEQAGLSYYDVNLSHNIDDFSRPHVVTNKAKFISDIDVGDIDGDGDLDIVSASHYNTGNDKLAWYDNIDGTGNFNYDNPIIIDTNFYAVRKSKLRDLDNDGDLDILVTSNNKVLWYENLDGQGNFSSQNVISNTINYGTDVEAADLDNDGDLDVVSSSFADQYVRWFENLDGQGNFSSGNIIMSGYEFNKLLLKDFNGDGYIDIASLTATYAFLMKTYNNGNGTFSSQFVDQNYPGEGYSFRYGDLNGDNIGDIVCATGYEPLTSGNIYWSNYEAGISAHQIFQSTNTTISDIELGDFDQDNDLDIIASSLLDGNIYLLKNNGTGSFNTPQIISSSYYRPGALASGDLNGDGKIDIVFGVGSTIFWLENTFGISNIDQANILKINLYPNPTSNILNIHNTNNYKIKQAKIYNLQGQEIMEFDKNFEHLDVSILSKGIYILELQTDGIENTTRIKFIKE